ncbi:hypothetical protein E2C01_021698 [Portunus trituberculatus]|uniref:Uncharacterized protein n=1 Tax=Portunus trituberculatus TaxID=210409 RepID=A0A5B7E5E1_PORTR|nr:hypothetical protein [Portunus trituberculatus]
MIYEAELNDIPSGHVNIDDEDKQEGVCGIQGLHQGCVDLPQPLLQTDDNLQPSLQLQLIQPSQHKLSSEPVTTTNLGQLHQALKGGRRWRSSGAAVVDQQSGQNFLQLGQVVGQTGGWARDWTIWGHTGGCHTGAAITAIVVVDHLLQKAVLQRAALIKHITHEVTEQILEKLLCE